MEAILRNEVIGVRYRSLTQPSPCWRSMALSAVDSDEFRCYASFPCASDANIKDLLQCKISIARASLPGSTSKLAYVCGDKEAFFATTSCPPASGSQHKTIAADRRIDGGHTQIKALNARPYCALSRLGLVLTHLQKTRKTDGLFRSIKQGFPNEQTAKL